MTNMRRSAAEMRRAQHERISSVVVQQSWVPGRVKASGVGEFEIDIDFGLTFTEKPILIPGAPESGNNSPQVEHIPSVEMAVSSWKRRRDNTGTSNHYTGATVVCRVAGRTEQNLWVTYLFIGKAFSSLGVQAIEEIE